MCSIWESRGITSGLSGRGKLCDVLDEFLEKCRQDLCGKKHFYPIDGAGITRFWDEKLSKQQLLEVMLWTMKISGFQCVYGSFRVNFIIHESDKDEMNFFELEKAWGNKV